MQEILEVVPFFPLELDHSTMLEEGDSQQEHLPQSQLSIIQQTSTNEEKVSKNGVQKNIHVVIKNTPFQLQLALESEIGLTFKNLALEVNLVYDSESLKPVSYIKQKPLDFKPVVNEIGDQVSLTTKIKVGNLFFSC